MSRWKAIFFGGGVVWLGWGLRRGEVEIAFAGTILEWSLDCRRGGQFAIIV